MSQELPKTIHEALTATALAMPALKKGDHNKHGGYSYVGVDDYFEKAASVAHANGLTWSLREFSCDIAEVNGKSAFKVKYVVDLYHTSGQEKLGFFSCTILHPIQGAQTAGSAMSYANKMFLRNAFQLVTGEEDADQTDNTAFDDLLAPTPQPTRRNPPGNGKTDPTKSTKSDGGAGGGNRSEVPEPSAGNDDQVALDAWVENTIKAWLPACDTVGKLNDFWVKNETLFARLKAENSELFTKLKAAFGARKAELS